MNRLFCVSQGYNETVTKGKTEADMLADGLKKDYDHFQEGVNKGEKWVRFTRDLSFFHFTKFDFKNFNS